MIGSCPPFTIVVEPVKMPPELLGSCLKSPELLNDPSFQRATGRCAQCAKFRETRCPYTGPPTHDPVSDGSDLLRGF